MALGDEREGRSSWRPAAPSDTPVNPRPRQMTLPGIGAENLPRPSLGGGGEDDPFTPNRDSVKLDALAEYGGPDGAHGGEHGKLDSPNPLYRPDVYAKVSGQSTDHFLAGKGAGHYDEFVQPSRVFSPQDDLNPRAVQHQVENANPLDLVTDPEMTAFDDDDGGESYMVYDGNHRVNAAQRRGQLLMPAHVGRYNEPNYHRGVNSVSRSRA